MAKNIRIIQIRPISITRLHLVIWETKFFPLVVSPLQATPKLIYLISAQIHGRLKLHFLSAHLREFFYIHSYYTIHFFSIYRYGVISRQSSVLIFGGFCDGTSASLIAKYTIDQWERVGNLQNSRLSHRAIANGDRIYVVGGEGTL